MNKETKWQMVALTVIIGCGAMWYWCYSGLLAKVTTDEITWNPPLKSELYMCVVYTLLMAAACLKLDIPLIGGILGNVTKGLMGSLKSDKPPDI